MDLVYDLLNWITVTAGDKVRHQHRLDYEYKWDYSYDGRYKPEDED